MKEKFLPIGTVCTIKGNNQKVMITGYLSIEYSEKIKLCDYSGCNYPEGLMVRNSLCSFNHQDIISIDHLGYESDEYSRFNKTLLSQQVDNVKLNTDSLFSNMEFDENGVVTFASEQKVEEPKHEVESVNNPFITSIHVEESPKEDTSSWPIFEKLESDENGVVIGEKITKKNKEEVEE